MIIKLDIDRNELSFFHIEVEELWNPEKLRDEFITTNCIYAQYYPCSKSFNHIDFSVNQYSKKIFEKKYLDSVADTKVPIAYMQM